MIIVLNGKDLEYAKDDSFELPIEESYDGEFADGSSLQFVVAKNPDAEPVINEKYSLRSDRTFLIQLNANNKKALAISENPYIYRITLIHPNGNRDTYKCGDLAVKWGVNV